MIPSKNHLFSPTLKMVVCIPSEVPKLKFVAVRDSSEHAGDVKLYDLRTHGSRHWYWALM
jgi:rod shape-determining protein MreB